MEISNEQAVSVLTHELTEAHAAIFQPYESEASRRQAWDRLDTVFRLIDRQPKQIANEVERRFEAGRKIN
jgi:hypothetical protein